MQSQILHGDCRVVLPTLASMSVDAVVTDPPYELGFMGRSWDRQGVAFERSVWAEVLRVLKPGGHLLAFSGTRTHHRMVCAIEDAGFEIRDQIGWAYGTGFPKSHNAGNGRGTALKPAWEPICVARKPLIGTIVENVLAHGTGALNIDGCRVPMNGEVVTTGQGTSDSIYGGGKGLRPLEMGTQQFSSHALGRWPANLIHDGSDEVLACFPTTGPSSSAPRNNGDFKSVSKGAEKAHVMHGHDDIGGSAARFFASFPQELDGQRLFYCPKAGKADRAGSKHPTVKPQKLMCYLCRLVTPPGGTVLDPFAGSGSTLYAARDEGFSAIGIEQDPEYVAHIEQRLSNRPTDLFAVAAE